MEWMKHFRYAPDDGGGSAGDGGTQPGTADGDGETPDAFDYAKWLAEQPEDVQGAIKAQADTDAASLKKALDAERDARKKLEKEAKDRDTAAKDAEKARMEEEGQFKELAEQESKRADKAEASLTEAQTKAAEVDRYAGALKAYLDKEREGVPEHVTELLDTLDPIAQLEYLAKHVDDLKPPTPPPGGPANGGPGGNGGGLSAEEISKRAYHYRSL